ncbi:MAG: TolC family protein [Trueperaceae bacterium]
MTLLTATALAVFVVSAQEPRSQDGSSSLSFMEALELSQQSPSVVLAQQQRDLAQQQLEVSEGTFSGELSTGYTQTWGETRTALPTGEEVTSLGEGSFDAFTLRGTFNVVPYGPNADAIQQALWSLEQAELSLRDAKADAVISTAESYLNALRATQDLELQQFSLEVANQQLEANRVRREAGGATDQQVLETEIDLSQAQDEVNTAQRTVIQALAALSNQLGVAVNAVAPEVPTVPAPEAVVPTGDLEPYISARTDVRQALIAVREAELNAASTTRDYLPSASLDFTFAANDNEQQVAASAGYDTRSFQPNASLTYDPSTPQGTEGSSSNSFSISLGASVPLESSLDPALEAAELNIEQNQTQAQQIQELARLEVDNSLRQLEAARSSLTLSEQLVTQSQETFDTTKERFDLGLIIELDVLTADEALRESQLTLARTQDSYLLALLNYLNSLAQNPMEVF